MSETVHLFDRSLKQFDPGRPMSGRYNIPLFNIVHKVACSMSQCLIDRPALSYVAGLQYRDNMLSHMNRA